MDLSQEVNQNTYLHNGFRIFNLPITSTQRKVSKEFSKIENLKNMNGWDSKEELDIYSNLPFPIIPKPNFINYQDANNRLSNSKKRFIDELFWFWPEDLDNKQDETLVALRNGDIEEALMIWKSSNASNASHNLAIYNHLLAVDKEVSGPNYAYKKYWREGLNHWHKTLSSNEFKNLVMERVRKLNDPTLKEEYAEEVFNQLPLAILSINAWFASSCLKNNDEKNFARHLGLINESNFDQKIKDESVKNIFNSIYEPLHEKYEEFENTVENSEFSSLSDIEKIDSFFNEIEDDLNLLKNHFSDNIQYQNFSGEIARSIKNAYVNIINAENKNDNLDKLDFEKVKEDFNKLKDMAYAFNVKQDIEHNFKLLESVKEGQKEGKIFTKIERFIEEGENDSINSAKQYADEISNELDGLDSENKENLSNGFAISLRGYVVANAMKLQENPSKFNEVIDDLLNLLRLAKDYAFDAELKDNIEENITAIESGKESGAENAIFAKIKRFIDEGENDSLYSAKQYAREVSDELHDLSSSNKDDISDAFAVSLMNYVIANVNKLQNNQERLLSSIDDFKIILKIAVRHAKNSENKNNIQENLDALNDIEKKAKNSGKENKIVEKIQSFLDNIEKKDISDAQKYKADIVPDLIGLDSFNKNSVSDGFAISLNAFVVSQVNSYGSSTYSFERNIKELLELLYTASLYATTKSTIDAIKGTNNTLTEIYLKIAGSKTDSDVMSLFGKIHNECKKKPVSDSGNLSGGGSGGGSGEGSGGKLKYIIILIILAALAAFIFGII